jgi:hypothetical protein
MPSYEEVFGLKNDQPEGVLITFKTIHYIIGLLIIASFVLLIILASVGWSKYYKEKDLLKNAFDYQDTPIEPPDAIPSDPNAQPTGAYTFFSINNLNPTFQVVNLPNAVFNTLRITNYGSFLGNTIVCTGVQPGPVPTYDPLSNQITSDQPPLNCPTNTLNDLFLFPQENTDPTNPAVSYDFNKYNEHFWCPTRLPGSVRQVFSNFDGNSQTLTIAVFLRPGSPLYILEYIPYFFIGVDEWTEINPPIKFWSASYGPQILFNSSNRTISYAIDNDYQYFPGQSGFTNPFSEMLGGPTTFTLKPGDSIFIRGVGNARYLETRNRILQ